MPGGEGPTAFVYPKTDHELLTLVNRTAGKTNKYTTEGLPGGAKE